MCMVRSPKSISGAVGATLGNAPYSDSDRTKFPVRLTTYYTATFCITLSRVNDMGQLSVYHSI
jgi:hypothetical protein